MFDEIGRLTTTHGDTPELVEAADIDLQLLTDELRNPGILKVDPRPIIVSSLASRCTLEK